MSCPFCREEPIVMMVLFKREGDGFGIGSNCLANGDWRHIIGGTHFHFPSNQTDRLRNWVHKIVRHIIHVGNIMDGK